VPPSELGADVDLRRWLLVLRRRWKLASGVCLGLVVLSVAVTQFQSPVYRSGAQVLVSQQRESIFQADGAPVVDPERAVRSDIALMKSDEVRTKVRSAAGEAPRVSAGADARSDIIKLSIESSDPERAAMLANAYAEAFIEARREAAVKDLDAKTRQLQPRVDDLQSRIEALSGRIQQLAPEQQLVTGQELRVSRDALIAEVGPLKQRLSELQVDASVQDGGARVVMPAVAASSPASPKPMLNLAVGVVLGLLLGATAAFVVDGLDDSVRSQDDLNRVAGGRPVLGLIPRYESDRGAGGGQVISLADPHSGAAEAYRRVRTSLLAIGLEQPASMVQLTSPFSAEGKTTTVANLGVALALSGARVVIVCCDLRRPRLHTLFGLSNNVGITSILSGQTTPAEALQDVPEVRGLRVLASGPQPPNPSEVLAQPRTATMLRSLLNVCDVVLLDCPPTLPVTDAVVVARWVDATVVVASAGVTKQAALAETLEQLEQGHAHIAGLVLNQVRAGYGYGYGYGYGHSYRYDESSSGRRSGRGHRHAAANGDRPTPRPLHQPQPDPVDPLLQRRAQ